MLHITNRPFYITFAALALTLVLISGTRHASAQNSPNFPDFSSTTGLNLVGDATQFNSVLRLTSAQLGQVGAAWYINKQEVGGGFVTVFNFQVTAPGGQLDADGNPGGDGFAFVTQNSNVSALGFAGGAQGYGGIPNSLAIEFDTWNSSALPFGINDPNGNHVSVHTRGILPNSDAEAFSLGSTTVIPDMSDGSVHTVMIAYEPGTLQIFVDDLSTAVLTIALNLADVLNLDDGTAFVGFTAGTGGAYENHDILSWLFTSGDIADLISIVNEFNLHPGIETSLTAKLREALAAVNGGDTATACTKLEDFINEVQAQSGKKITVNQGNQLIAVANLIKTSLGCQ
jgi:hypothetical protein